MTKFGRDWKKVQRYIGTRSGAQIRSHAQKHFMKNTKDGKSSAIEGKRPIDSYEGDKIHDTIQDPAPERHDGTPSVESCHQNTRVGTNYNPFQSLPGMLPPLASFTPSQRPDLSNIPYGLRELTGARQVETLYNKVGEVIALLNSGTLDSEQIASFKQELSYSILDLHSVFPNIALNPALCEKWSRTLKASVEGSQKEYSSAMLAPAVPYPPAYQM